MTCIARKIAGACFLWMLLFFLLGGSRSGIDLLRKAACYSTHDHKGGIPLIMLTIPMLLAGSVCALVLSCRIPSSPCSDRRLRSGVQRQQQQQLPLIFPRWIHRHYQRLTAGSGDVNFDVYATLFLAFPSIIYLISSINRHVHNNPGMDAKDASNGVANAFGMLAMISFSFLLVPVAKYGPILRLFGWCSAKALRLHVWCGRIVTIGSLIHGLIHIMRWRYILGESVRSMFIPRPECWWNYIGSSVPRSFESLSSDKCTCLDLFQNSAGLLAVIGIVTVGVTSLNVIRRQCYKLFYMSHIIAVPIILLAIVLHYRRAVLYISPSALYYVASSVPGWIESWSMRRNGSVKVLSVEEIGCSLSCDQMQDHRSFTSLTIEASDMAIRTFRAGMFVKLYTPNISHIHHPFTVNKVPGTSNQLRIIFRQVGRHTRALAKYLTNTSMPIVHVDGYHGSPQRVEQVLKHDVSVMIAGGIGITPYLSLLGDVCVAMAAAESASPSINFPTKTIVLHWMCREQALIDYISREYFQPLIDNYTSSRLRIKVTIHKTGSGDLRKKETTVDVPFAAPDCDKAGPAMDNEFNPIVMPFTPSRFSVQDVYSTIQTRVSSFVIFMLTAWLGLIATWYFYKAYQDDEQAWRRSYALLAMLMIALIVSLPIVCISFYNQGRNHTGMKFQDELKQGIMDDGFDETSLLKPKCIIGCKECELCRKDASETISYESYGTLSETEVSQDDFGYTTLTHRNGRPSVEELLIELNSARLPGVFCCGPTAMTDKIHKLAEDKHVGRLEEFAKQDSAYIAIYDESFLL